MEALDYVTLRRNASHHPNVKRRSRDVQLRSAKSAGGSENEKKMREDESGDFPGGRGPGVLRDITNTDEGKSRGWSHRRRNEVAWERWQMLAKALLKPKKIGRTVQEISVRRFASFDLVTPTKLDKLETAEGCWSRYAAKVHNKVYHVEVHHLEQKLTPEDLAGFNNTGNICIWPSEEVLAFYVLSHVRLFAGKEVLEVGGGMTSLAGLVLAKYGNLRRADLTDGNLSSVDNVRDIIRRNRLEDGRAASFRLDWTDHSRLAKKYDVVLSSDCLFFDETRADLAETIWKSLKSDGVALVVAPKRGATLDSFVEIAAERGFCCVLQSHYSETVWRQHLKFKKSSPEYDEDLHYPLLLFLTKSSQGFPLSYLLT